MLRLLVIIAFICWMCSASPAQDQASAHMYPVGDPPTTGEIVPGRVVYRADPRYPKEAKNQRIHGTVELIATIDQSGNVSAIAISSGDLTLAEAAVDAVRSWKFEPYTQNGRPVEAWQELRFNVAPGSKKVELDTRFPPAEIAKGMPFVSHQMRPRGVFARAIFAPAPEYSEAARKARYQGVCTLSLTVGADGLAHDIKVARALGMGLDKSAVETVTRWRFQPVTRDGEPISTEETVEVSFHLR